MKTWKYYLMVALIYLVAQVADSFLHLNKKNYGMVTGVLDGFLSGPRAVLRIVHPNDKVYFTPNNRLYDLGFVTGVIVLALFVTSKIGGDDWGRGDEPAEDTPPGPGGGGKKKVRRKRRVIKVAGRLSSWNIPIEGPTRN